MPLPANRGLMPVMPGFATWQGLVNLADLPIWQRQSGNAAFGAGKSRFSG
jgi:hypothetical protein